MDSGLTGRQNIVFFEQTLSYLPVWCSWSVYKGKQTGMGSSKFAGINACSGWRTSSEQTRYFGCPLHHEIELREISLRNIILLPGVTRYERRRDANELRQSPNSSNCNILLLCYSNCNQSPTGHDSVFVSGAVRARGAHVLTKLTKTH